MAHGPGTEKKKHEEMKDPGPPASFLFCGDGMDAVPQPQPRVMDACSRCSFRWSPSPHERMDGRGGGGAQLMKLKRARTHRVAWHSLSARQHLVPHTRADDHASED